MFEHYPCILHRIYYQMSNFKFLVSTPKECCDFLRANNAIFCYKRKYFRSSFYYLVVHRILNKIALTDNI